VLSTTPQQGYKQETVSYESEPGIRIPGLLVVPDGPGKKPAVLMVSKNAEAEELVKAGNVVFAIRPRGVSEGPQPARRNEFVGDYSSAARAYVMGKTLVGMRAEDIIRAVDYLVSRSDVDAARISAVGEGSLGVPLAHAAVIDKRIGRLTLRHTMASYRAAVDHPIYRGLYDVLVPGVVRKYDMDDLLAALAPRPVTVIKPADHLGRTVRPGAPRPATQ
jgi:cephalosporin-C deacetylase-like acetyl esterase